MEIILGIEHFMFSKNKKSYNGFIEFISVPVSSSIIYWETFIQ